MNYGYLPDIIHSSKQNKDYYVVRLCLTDNEGKVVAKSNPIMWISEEQYKELLNINK